MQWVDKFFNFVIIKTFFTTIFYLIQWFGDSISFHDAPLAELLVPISRSKHTNLLQKEAI